MANFLFFIFGIVVGMILLALFCATIVGAEAEEKIERMNKEKENKNG